MQESASAGLSYIRSRAARFGLEADFYANMEIHIHIPEGAVPKDGPSAGITMLTAMISALTETPVRAKLAMTGEVTLGGEVLAIGGLNEKLIAAKRLGITDIIIPFRNKKDLPELPRELTSGLNLMPAKKMAEVIRIAFGGSTPRKANQKKPTPRKKK
jgi:ATP-dependent Lon protease